MKKNLFVYLLLFAVIKLCGQNYYVISFVGDGAAIESISVENISQGTSLVLDGTDILHLLHEAASVNGIEKENKTLKIYPNPMMHTCNIEFNNPKHGNVSIMLYSITGKQILYYSNVLSQGSHTFSLKGVAAGTYLINIQTESDYLTGKIVSFSQNDLATSSIQKLGIVLNYAEEKTDIAFNNLRDNRGNMSIIEMDFNIGDELKFTAYADGLENNVIYDSPVGDKTYTFVFAETCNCGEPFTDIRDGYIYKTVKIGEQCWFAENLKFLPEGKDFDRSIDGSTTAPYYYIYDFSEGGSMAILEEHEAYNNYITYGILYNWSAAMGWDGVGNPPSAGAQGICPEGWHLPTHGEWTTLERSIGSSPNAFPYTGPTVGWLGSDEGDALKDADFGWCNGVPCGTSGFSALPGGRRYTGGIYYGIGFGARWWTSTEFGAGAWRRYLEAPESGVNRFTDYKTFGFSVRCIRD